jgi:hypothetical protein
MSVNFYGGLSKFEVFFKYENPKFTKPLHFLHHIYIIIERYNFLSNMHINLKRWYMNKGAYEYHKLYTIPHGMLRRFRLRLLDESS